jgi:hypothetical protein
VTHNNKHKPGPKKRNKPIVVGFSLVSFLFLCFYMPRPTSPKKRAASAVSHARLHNQPIDSIQFDDRCVGGGRMRLKGGRACAAAATNQDASTA